MNYHMQPKWVSRSLRKRPRQLLHGWPCRIKSHCWTRNPKNPRCRETAHSNKVLHCFKQKWFYTNKVHAKCIKHFISISTWPQTTKKYTKVLPTVADLGLRWNHRADTLVFSQGTSPDLNSGITQRVVLSVLLSGYGPSTSLLHTPWRPVSCWRTSGY